MGMNNKVPLYANLIIHVSVRVSSSVTVLTSFCTVNMAYSG